MVPDAIQVMGRVVAVGVVTCRLFTGPGGDTKKMTVRTIEV